MKNKAYKDTAFNIVDYLSTLVIFLITTKLLIDQLGTDGYGFYIFFTSLIGTFGLVDIGMGVAVSKYLSEYLHHKKFDEGNQVITQAIVFYLVVGFLLVIIVNSFAEQVLTLLNFDDKFFHVGKEILFITSIVFAANLLVSIGTNVLVALEEWQRISLINIILKLINALLLIYILLLDVVFSTKIHYIFYSILVIAFIKLISYSMVAFSKYPHFELRKPSKVIRGKINNFLKHSSMQYALSIMVGHIDKFIISGMFGLTTLGVYSFAANAFAYLCGFNASVFKIFLPKLSVMHSKNDWISLTNSLKKLLKYSYALSAIVGLFSLITWNQLVGLYISQDFASDSLTYFVFFAIYLFARSPEAVVSYFFNAIAKPVELVKNVAIESFVTICSYFILVPIFSVIGLTISHIIGCIALYAFVFYKIKSKYDCR